MGVIRAVLILLILLTEISAQEKSSIYYEERQQMYQEIPPIGTMFLYNSRIIAEYYDERKEEISGDIGMRLYLNLYYGYESLGIFIQFMSEYENHQFNEINNEREYFGYDSKSLSWLQTKGKVYLNNWYILQRNLSYYFGQFLQTVRIGKLWLNYSPYTIYRTFGPEGISFEGNIFPVKYHIFYSYNKVVNNNGDVTNSRNLAGVKFYFNETDYFIGELIGVYYNITGFRSDKIGSIRLGKEGIMDVLYLELLDVEKQHSEIEQKEDYYGYFRRILTRFFLVFGEASFSYRITSVDFFPYNNLTWTRYEPTGDAIYDWIYEEERAIRNNERAYNLELKYNISGIRFRNVFDCAYWLDKNKRYNWLNTNPPGFRTQFEVSYLIGWVTITHKFWQKIINSTDSNEVPVYASKLQIFSSELYLPITSNISAVPRIEYFRKYNSSNVITDKLVEFFQLRFSFSNLKFLIETKYSEIDMDEPGWLLSTPYYREQSWGIDNYIRIRMEYNF